VNTVNSNYLKRKQMKDILLVINGMAGNGKNGNSTFRIVRNFARNGIKTTVCPIAEGVSMEIEDYLAEKDYDAVVCVGGDGTINSAVNKIMQFEKRPVLGYIPAGTTNDFSKNLKLEKDTDAACRQILNGKCVEYDLGCFNGRYFNYVAAFGAFAAISYNTDQKAKNTLGYAAYILNAIISAPEHLSSKCHMKIETGTDTIEGDFIFGAVCNSLSVAGMKIENMTESNLYDGEFELILIKYPESGHDLTGTLYSLLQGNFDDPHIVYRKITECRLQSEDGIRWSLDGEYGGDPQEVEFHVVPHAVRIMTGLSDESTST